MAGFCPNRPAGAVAYFCRRFAPVPSGMQTADRTFGSRHPDRAPSYLGRCDDVTLIGPGSAQPHVAIRCYFACRPVATPSHAPQVRNIFANTHPPYLCLRHVGVELRA